MSVLPALQLGHQLAAVIKAAAVVQRKVMEFEQICDVRNAVQVLVLEVDHLRVLTTRIVQGDSEGPGTTRPQLAMPGLDLDVPPPSSHS